VLTDGQTLHHRKVLAEVWGCESESFAHSVSIKEHGEWSHWSHGRQHAMASPIEQSRRHVHLLERAYEFGLAPLPHRLGLAAAETATQFLASTMRYRRTRKASR
jgi:hypothetical protein